MYWWWKAAQLVASGSATRAGLITTNSITQPTHQPVIHAAREAGAEVVWAIPDHPWTDEVDGAAVRVAMTVLARVGASLMASWQRVDDRGLVVESRTGVVLNDALSPGIDVARAAMTPLLANVGLSWAGVKLHGSGFILKQDEAKALLTDSRYTNVVRPYLNGRDLASRSRSAYVIDFGIMEYDDAERYPLALNIVRDRVYPERQGNRDPTFRAKWWRFGRSRPELREAVIGLRDFLVTLETSKHRFFLPLTGDTVPDNKLWAFCTDERWLMAVLSSQIHLIWALEAGSRLEDRPVYVAPRCFEAFPFPDPPREVRTEVGKLAVRLDTHRRDAIIRDERVTMTKMYNVIEKLRSGEPLTAQERTIHETAACGVLKDLHDELDALVAEAYGWPWPMEREEVLERLVALHDERVAEERAGKVRWLRPDYQIPRYGQGATAQTAVALPDPERGPEPATPVVRTPWPATAVEQVAAVKLAANRVGTEPDRVAAAFEGADARLVHRHLETLVLMGELQGTVAGLGWYP